VTLAVYHFYSQSTPLFAYFALGNLTITILVRNELLLIFFYWSFKFIPVFKFQLHRMLISIGGLHVGAGIATDVWIIVYSVHMFTQTSFSGTWPEWIMRVTVIIIAAGLTLMVVTSLAPLRSRYHNVWEYTHRFVGWFSLVTLVVHILAKAATMNTVGAIFKTPLPYLTIICLASVFYVWFTARRVPVMTYSGHHVALIKFPGKPTMQAGAVVRVSTNLLEWHAFGVALVDPAKRDFGIIVAPAGDWTRTLVDKIAKGEAQGMMWIRGINSVGFMYMHCITL
jgi:hypothetical protein